jgi:hypothetical protein
LSSSRLARSRNIDTTTRALLDGLYLDPWNRYMDRDRVLHLQLHWNNRRSLLLDWMKDKQDLCLDEETLLCLALAKASTLGVYIRICIRGCDGTFVGSTL